MFIFASIILCLVGVVTNNPVPSRHSPRVIFSFSTLLDISKLIDEANRCPSQTENTLCSWNWVPDIKETRIPRVIYKAQKRTDSTCERSPYKECRSENKRFDVMYLTQNSQGVYDLSRGVEELPVAMSCVEKETVINGQDVSYDDDYD